MSFPPSLGIKHCPVTLSSNSSARISSRWVCWVASANVVSSRGCITLLWSGFLPFGEVYQSGPEPTRPRALHEHPPSLSRTRVREQSVTCLWASSWMLAFTSQCMRAWPCAYDQRVVWEPRLLLLTNSFAHHQGQLESALGRRRWATPLKTIGVHRLFYSRGSWGPAVSVWPRTSRARSLAASSSLRALAENPVRPLWSSNDPALPLR